MNQFKQASGETMKSFALTLTFGLAFATLAHGQILISEVMQNPEDVIDSDGEWFEVYNASGSPIDLQGWDILDNGSEMHTISSSVVVPAGGFATLCIDSDPAFNGINGGFTCDYQYSGILLFNSGDAIILRNTSDTEIDRVEYDGGPNWPAPFGASIVFVGSASDDNNDPSNWIAATVREPSYGAIPINCCDKGSPGTLGSSATLPVELVSFDGVLSGASVILRWETASETNNAGFSVQQRIESVFSEIAFVDGNGTTRQRSSYEHRVDNLPPGTHAFRLKQIDIDGSFGYSRQVLVDVLPEGPFELSLAYPNPSNSASNFSLTATRSQQVVVDVVDLLGRRVAVIFDGEVSGGERRTFTLDSAGWPNGNYVYRVRGEGFEQVGLIHVVR